MENDLNKRLLLVSIILLLKQKKKRNLILTKQRSLSDWELEKKITNDRKQLREVNSPEKFLRLCDGLREGGVTFFWNENNFLSRDSRKNSSSIKKKKTKGKKFRKKYLFNVSFYESRNLFIVFLGFSNFICHFYEIKKCGDVNQFSWFFCFQKKEGWDWFSRISKKGSRV